MGLGHEPGLYAGCPFKEIELARKRPPVNPTVDVSVDCAELGGALHKDIEASYVVVDDAARDGIPYTSSPSFASRTTMSQRENQYRGMVEWWRMAQADTHRVKAGFLVKNDKTNETEKGQLRVSRTAGMQLGDVV